MKHYRLHSSNRNIIVLLNRAFTILMLPHIVLALILGILTNIVFGISVYFNENGDPFLSSIFANIYSGMITGLIICLISGIKQVYYFKISAEIKWLEELHNQLLEYIEDHHRLLIIRFDDCNENEEIYNFINDIGCKVSQINSTIEQSSFNKTLPFNSIKLCKKEFGYDALQMSKTIEDLHEKLLQIDIDCTSSKTVISYFDSVHPILWKLNSSVLNKISSLQVYEAMLQKTIL